MSSYLRVPDHGDPHLLPCCEYLPWRLRGLNTDRHNVYIVAQQTTPVYYLSYPCKTDKCLQGWSVVYKVSPHGKLLAPGNEDYHVLDPNTYDRDFFQEDGLEGSFEIDLTQAIEMEVDN
jgi:hypothetical protein